VVVAGAAGDAVVAAAAADLVGPGRAGQVVAARRPGDALRDDGRREGEQGDDDENGGALEHVQDRMPQRGAPPTPQAQLSRSSHGA